MAYPLSLTQSQALTALRAVLLAALPAGVEVIQSQDNRVPEPVGADWVAMTPILRNRLSTNVDEYADAAFTGSVSGSTLTVSAVTLGAISVAARPLLFGPTVAAGTAITVQTAGTPGGAGTYTVSVSQTIASGPLAAGVVGAKQPTQLTVQLDIHGPQSADNVQMLATLMRSWQGADLFAAQGFDVTPLYASDPRQSPWVNAEQQIERTWSIDVELQINPVVTIPQQFAQALDPTIEPPADAYPL